MKYELVNTVNQLPHSTKAHTASRAGKAKGTETGRRGRGTTSEPASDTQQQTNTTIIIIIIIIV